MALSHPAAGPCQRSLRLETGTKPCYSRAGQPGEGHMARILYFLFALAAYLLFFATFLYLIAFVGDLPWVPVTVDRGGDVGPVALAIPVNLALIALFRLQHSVMAPSGFKRAWTRIVPRPIERSVYVVAASLALILLFLFWRPIPGTIWSVEIQAGAAILWALFGLGWL